MDIGYEMMEIIFKGWDAANKDDVVGLSCDAYNLYQVLQRGGSTILRSSESFDIRSCLVAGVLKAATMNPTHKLVALVIPGKSRQRKAIVYAKQLDTLLRELFPAHFLINPVLNGDTENYLCIHRYYHFRNSIQDKSVLATLSNSRQQMGSELTYSPLVNKDIINQVRVRDCPSTCLYRLECKYSALKKSLESGDVEFQICSPHLFTRQIFDYHANDRIFRFPKDMVAIVTDIECLDAASKGFTSRRITKHAFSSLVSVLLHTNTGNKRFHAKTKDICFKLERESMALFSAVLKPGIKANLRRISKILKYTAFLQELCSHHDDIPYRVKKQINYLYQVFNDLYTRPEQFQIQANKNQLKIVENNLHRRKTIISALKAAPVQTIFLQY